MQTGTNQLSDRSCGERRLHSQHYNTFNIPINSKKRDSFMQNINIFNRRI